MSSGDAMDRDVEEFAAILSELDGEDPGDTVADEVGEDEVEVEDEVEAEDEEEAEGEEDEEDEDEGWEEEEELDEDADDDEEAEDPDAPRTYKVKVDGEEIEVSLEEALAGYQRNLHYTKGRQELAAARKEVSLERERLVAERGEAAEKLDLLEMVYKELMPEEPDWEALRKRDKAEYAAQRHDWAARQRDIEAIRARKEEERGAAVKEMQKLHQEQLAESHARLQELIPGWGSDAALSKEVVEYAAEAGFSAEELANVADWRAVHLLWKAMQFDKGRQKLEGKKRQEAKKAPVLKPGGRKPAPSAEGAVRRKSKDRMSKLERRLKNTGSPDDFAAWLVEGADSGLDF